jgi:TPR repeat protein
VSQPIAPTNEPARAASVAPAGPPPPQVRLLLSRASDMLALGDLSAARLLYQRAAALGSGQAATALGRTYDPAYLAAMKATGIRPDRTAAAAWYRKGAALGDPEAAERLTSLGSVP